MRNGEKTMTDNSLDDWKSDNGMSYELPLIVDAPEGKRDISDWAKDRICYGYWLCLRSGTHEWNARVFVPRSILITLQHGKTYTRQELLISEDWQDSSLKMPEKLQFIVEKI